MAFLSSRMLPGQRFVHRAAAAARVEAQVAPVRCMKAAREPGCRPGARAAGAARCSTPFRRKYRSGRNSPTARALEIAVRSRDEAHVDGRLHAAEAQGLAVLEHAQELGLRRERDLADLVEEDGAAVAVSSRPGFAASRR